jgi:hypothetical protein
MGTSHRTIETPVFTFDQLSPEVQAQVIDRNRDINIEHEWWSSVFEDAVTMADIIGIDIDTLDNSSYPKIYFNGFSSQGDGASFEGSYSYKHGALKELKSAAPARYKDSETQKWVDLPSNAELHRICKALTAVQRRLFYKLEAEVVAYGHYSHSGCNRITVRHAEDRYRDIGEAEGEVTHLLRDFMDWIYRCLEREHDYLTSGEQVTAALADMEFTAEGAIV